ncbi:ATP-binding protein [Piscinibacter sp.]|jgi:PAS domain S-box-containing protein|uniref:hybrid sensor histidine kinase/response regulator n=1 Tax=Piscinibacter sp. TaxID=1903157 RepID=UPI0035597419
MTVQHSGARFRWLVIGPFLIVVVLLAALGVTSAEILSAVRAYVGGESLWSKGQKDAVYHLGNYTASHNAADYQRFLDAIAIPQGDRKARAELELPNPDLAVARRGFLEGGNHPDDVGAMIWLFRTFRNVPFMADAIAIWAEADTQIAELNDLASAVHQRVLAGDLSSPQSQALLERIGPLNHRLTGLELRFSATMGEASRTSLRLVQFATLFLALALAAAAVLMSLSLLRRQSRAQQALGVSEERLQRALDASGLCLWDFDLESGGVYLSESWSSQLGGPHEVTRTTFTALSELVPEDERPALFEALVTALKDPQAVYRVEHRVKKRDGEWLWNLSVGRVVERSADGRALRMMGTNRDITERKQAEATRRGLEAQLRESQKMEAIGTLAGGIAHDFNNILGAILGNLALARDDVGEGHAAQRSLEQINKSALRARGLVQQILAFGRRQPHELTIRPLRPLVQETLALMRSTLPAGVSLESALADAPLHVLADTTQLQQVLMNLCTNAWHALQGQVGRVVVGLDAIELPAEAAPQLGGLSAGDYAHLWVSDTGCGMDFDTQARIFEPFFTTKPVGQGTGLGLSVVHGIVEAHNAAITVESAPGQGSTFHLYFPLTDSQDPAPTSELGALQPLDSQGGGQHVLYVDDDEVMTLLVERLLRRLGYRVTCYEDPRQAIAAVRAEPHTFDLVVSDFNMPEISGLDVAREVARVRADLPVVISSGHITEQQRTEILRAGVRNLVQKENTFEELGAVVERVLRETAT